MYVELTKLTGTISAWRSHWTDSTSCFDTPLLPDTRSHLFSKYLTALTTALQVGTLRIVAAATMDATVGGRHWMQADMQVIKPYRCAGHLFQRLVRTQAFMSIH